MVYSGPASWFELSEMSTADLEYLISVPHLFCELTVTRAQGIIGSREAT